MKEALTFASEQVRTKSTWRSAASDTTPIGGPLGHQYMHIQSRALKKVLTAITLLSSYHPMARFFPGIVGDGE